MPQGRVKRLVSDRGFGFIEDDRGDAQFFHHSAVQGSTIEDLREGQVVGYKAGRRPKGQRAESVQVGPSHRVDGMLCPSADRKFGTSNRTPETTIPRFVFLLFFIVIQRTICNAPSPAYQLHDW